MLLPLQTYSDASSCCCCCCCCCVSSLQYAAALAAAQASSRPPGIRYWAANMLLDLLDSQWFLQLQPQLQLLAATVQQYPEVAWAVLVSPLMLLLGLAARVSSNYFKVSNIPKRQSMYCSLHGAVRLQSTACAHVTMAGCLRVFERNKSWQLCRFE